MTIGRIHFRHCAKHPQEQQGAAGRGLAMTETPAGGGGKRPGGRVYFLRATRKGHLQSLSTETPTKRALDIIIIDSTQMAIPELEIKHRVLSLTYIFGASLLR